MTEDKSMVDKWVETYEEQEKMIKEIQDLIYKNGQATKKLCELEFKHKMNKRDEKLIEEILSVINQTLDSKTLTVQITDNEGFVTVKDMDSSDYLKEQFTKIFKETL